MRFKSQLHIPISDVEKTNTDYIFVGNTIDDRSQLMLERLKKVKSKALFSIDFNADNMNFYIDEASIPFMSLNHSLSERVTLEVLKTITLDSTSLGVIELLYILRWIKSLNSEININILYAEPQDYPSTPFQNSEFGKHQFTLSDSSIGYKSLPGFTKTAHSNIKTHVIALLGFERVRLGQLLQNDEGSYIERVSPIFGVPGFKPSYDKHSAFQNIDALIQKGKKPMFSCANNPYETLKTLDLITQSKPDTTFNIAPIGTKPMAIGACIFLLNNMNKYGLLYDHPNKKNGRTLGISKVHRYSLITSSSKI